MAWRNKLPSSHDYRTDSGARNESERVVCVLNPRAQAGRAGSRVDELRRAVDRAFAKGEVWVSEGPGHATELAAKAIAEGADIVAAVGGDGTCNEVVNGFFEQGRARNLKAVFTVIPWGTGSDLAKSVRAPTDLADALWVAATGMTLPADVGFAEYTGHDGQPASRVFINVAGFGANGDVVSRANKATKKLGGRATFLQATLGSLVEYDPPRLKVSWKGPEGEGAWDGQLLSGFVANGAYCGGGMWVGRYGTMHDGLLDMTLLPHKGRLRNVAESWRLYDGSIGEVLGCRRVQVTELLAEPLEEEPVLIDLDGEGPGRLPLRIRVVAGQLQLRGGWLRSPLLSEERPRWRPKA